MKFQRYEILLIHFFHPSLWLIAIGSPERCRLPPFPFPSTSFLFLSTLLHVGLELTFDPFPAPAAFLLALRYFYFLHIIFHYAREGGRVRAAE